MNSVNTFNPLPAIGQASSANTGLMWKALSVFYVVLLVFTFANSPSEQAANPEAVTLSSMLPSGHTEGLAGYVCKFMSLNENIEAVENGAQNPDCV
jgi:hypothetical protein